MILIIFIAFVICTTVGICSTIKAYANGYSAGCKYCVDRFKREFPNGAKAL